MCSYDVLKEHLLNTHTHTHVRTRTHTRTYARAHTTLPRCAETEYLKRIYIYSVLLATKGGIAPNQVIARSEFEVHRQI